MVYDGLWWFMDNRNFRTPKYGGLSYRSKGHIFCGDLPAVVSHRPSNLGTWHGHLTSGFYRVSHDWTWKGVNNLPHWCLNTIYLTGVNWILKPFTSLVWNALNMIQGLLGMETCPTIPVKILGFPHRWARIGGDSKLKLLGGGGEWPRSLTPCGPRAAWRCGATKRGFTLLGQLRCFQRFFQVGILGKCLETKF